MALPLEGFVTDEQQFPGLYKAGDTIERNRYRGDQLALQKQSRVNAAGNFLDQYLDQKQFLTGTNYDPEIVTRLSAAMQKGAQLAQQGADTPTLMMALGKDINEINEYSLKAKAINAQKKQVLELIKKEQGVDPQKFSEQFDELAFYDVDQNTGQRKLRDISTIDPNVDYGSRVLSERPEFVTTSEGFDTFFKQAASNPVVRTEDIYRYNKKGGMTREKSELKYENYLIPDEDNRGAVLGFVPKYEVATDEGSPVMNMFKDKDGNEVAAPVRLLDKGIFESLPASALNYVKGQTKLALREYEKKTGQKIPINSLQAENVARALAYDELNKDTRKSGSIKSLEIQNKPSPYEIKMNLGIPLYKSGSSSSSADVNVNDVFNSIDQAASEASASYAAGNNSVNYVLGSQLNSDAQDIVMKNLSDFTPSEVKVIKGADGRVGVYELGTGKVLKYITPTSVNIAAQPSVKEKRKVIEQSKKTAPSTTSKPKIEDLRKKYNY